MNDDSDLPNPDSPRRSPMLMIGCVVAGALGIGCFSCVGLLAAIAVPNFLEAQTRSMVSRVQSDLRMMAVALEAYHVDNDAFPLHTLDRTKTLLNGAPSMNADPTVPFPLQVAGAGPATLTSPLAYLSSYPADPFRARDPEVGYAYHTSGQAWIIYSTGPDNTYDITNPAAFFDPDDGSLIWRSWATFEFDPTNGTNSGGDVLRVSEPQS